ncbi:hypothetical protein [Chitinimonas sp.]|uniref:hypothetical protein n=1 Tax=Chitinimonas sp. TaxID=1934313 RepID=UPI002F94C0A2
MQSIRRGLFLKPGREPGDVDTTELIAQAGVFLAEIDALDTATEWLDPHDFLIYPFYLEHDDLRIKRTYQ